MWHWGTCAHFKDTMTGFTHAHQLDSKVYISSWENLGKHSVVVDHALQTYTTPSKTLALGLTSGSGGGDGVNVGFGTALW